MSQRELSFLGRTQAGDEGSDVSGQVMTYSVSQTTGCCSTGGGTTDNMMPQCRVNGRLQVRDTRRGYALYGFNEDVRCARCLGSALTRRRF